MSLKLRKDLLAVALYEKVFVFNFSTLKLIEQIETCLNPTGILAVSPGENPVHNAVAFPHVE